MYNYPNSREIERIMIEAERERARVMRDFFKAVFQRLSALGRRRATGGEAAAR